MSGQVLRDATGAPYTAETAKDRKRRLHREANKRYQQRHPEKKRENYTKTRERVLELQKARRDKDIDAWRAKERNRYAANPAKALANSKKWASRHPDKRRESAVRLAKKYPWRVPVYTAKFRAQRSGLAFDLDEAWSAARWTGLCELSGLPFRPANGRGAAGPFSASLDRIDSTQGYLKDNCRFVLWGVNRFKNADTDAEIIEIARAICAKYGVA